MVDFWNTDGPANKQNNPADCSQTNQPNSTCPNEDDILGRQAVADINSHDPSTPLFMFFASHSIHEPYEAPDAYLEKFKSVDVEVRQYYDAMVNHVDDVIGTIVSALKSNVMWENTLIICSSDNVCHHILCYFVVGIIYQCIMYHIANQTSLLLTHLLLF